MGLMRFLAPRRERVSQEAVERAYLAGMEGVPWLSRNARSDDQIVIEREISESGNLYIPWNVEGYGEVVLSTASLMERKQPYHLSVELARGTLNRLRGQVAAWQTLGLNPSDELQQRMSKALDGLALAATAQANPVDADEKADRAIRLSLDAIDLLGRDYSRRVLAIRHKGAPKLNTLLAISIDAQPLDANTEQAVLAACNSAVIPFLWKDIEESEGERDWSAVDEKLRWCRSHKLKTCSGPLLRLDARSLPDWLFLWEDDFDNLQSYVLDYVKAVVQRYKGQIQIWQCAAGMNVEGAMALSEEEKLRLTVDVINNVRRADKNTPIVVTFDQPWAEYLNTAELDLSPLHFADALVRADIGVSGIALEINLGYWPGGTLPRDVLEVSRKIDTWSVLGLPLLVMLTIPSADGDDPLASHAGKPLPAAVPGGWTPAAQQKWAERLLPLLGSKQSLYALIWNQLSDAHKHSLPHGGLLDAQGKVKPVLQTLAAFRQAHLM
jgi:hypothetical protein